MVRITFEISMLHRTLFQDCSINESFETIIYSVMAWQVQGRISAAARDSEPHAYMNMSYHSSCITSTNFTNKAAQLNTIFFQSETHEIIAHDNSRMRKKCELCSFFA